MDLVIREAEIRHERPRLHRWWVLDPPREVLLVHRCEQAAGDALLARDVGELGPDLAGRLCSFDRVAADAGKREEELAALLRVGIAQAVGLLHGIRGPRAVVVLRVRDERDEHVRVPGAAELEALTAVRARLVRLDPDLRRTSRDRVLLP